MVLGTTSGGMNLGQAFYRQAIESPQIKSGQASRVLHYQAQRQALDVMDAFGFRGPVSIIGNACASGANAVGHAWELLRRGHAERVLTGGYDALSELVFAGFDSLQALSPTRCRPFDANRDGLALGEGAAVLTLETFDMRDGATPKSWERLWVMAPPPTRIILLSRIPRAMRLMPRCGRRARARNWVRNR